MKLENKPLPPEYTEPFIPEGYQEWMEAFWELDTERQVMDGNPRPIPWSSIKAFGSNMPAEEFEFFHFTIRKMDYAYLRFRRTGVGSQEVFTRDMFRGALGK